MSASTHTTIGAQRMIEPEAPAPVPRTSTDSGRTSWGGALDLLGTFRKTAAVGGVLAVALGCAVGGAPVKTHAHEHGFWDDLRARQQIVNRKAHLRATQHARWENRPMDPGGQMQVRREADGSLTVEATPGNDEIEISRNRDGTIRVTVNGSARDFAAEDAAQLNVLGGDGDDTIRIKSGNKIEEIAIRVEGGRGNDKIYGGPGHDVLMGNEGDDEIWGGGGDDYLSGGPGNDELYGGTGRDILIGGSGDDLLDGGDGDDFLDGGSGNDQLIGGKGRNVVVGAPIGDAGHTIAVRGSAEFVDETNEALRLLRATPTGRVMLEQIDKSGHRVTIVEMNESNATASEIDTQDAFVQNGRRGRGTDVTVTWNPRFPGIQGEEKWAFTPPAVILGHELVHAYNMVTGSMVGPRGEGPPDPRVVPPSENLAVGLPFDHDGNRRTRPISVERFYKRLGLPVVSENALRAELGWAKRMHY